MKSVTQCVLFLTSSVFLWSCEVQKTTAPHPTLALDQNAPTATGTCSDQHRGNPHSPVAFLCVITLPAPANPIRSSDIAWVDPKTERYYVADRSNSGVDIIDVEKGAYVGRVGGMIGGFPTTPTTGGGTATTNGAGPNGVVVTPNGQLWAGDGNSTVRVADVDPHSPNYLQIIQSVSTAISACDGGTAMHYCGRADEIGYDPEHHVILIANPSPLSLTKCTATGANCTTSAGVAAAGGALDPYATFISAKPPYAVLGHVSFVGAGGLEQPLWDPETHRFFLTVPGKTGVTPASIAVINPERRIVEKTYALDCLALTGTAGVGITGIALGESQHLLVSACGYPIIFHARTGALISVIKDVGGGDEVWYNQGDHRFYVTGASTATAVQSLGVIDAEKGTWLQNVPDVLGKNPAAFAEDNHILTVVQITAAILAAPATDNSICASVGVKGTGCIAVFAHVKGSD